MPTPPYRWDPGANLGSLLEGVPDPRLWFLGDLASCMGQVLARSRGSLCFVGRSLDSGYDLLGAACSGLEAAPALLRLPVSTAQGWEPRTPQEVMLRELLVGSGVTLHGGPVTFVDVVDRGGTFTELFEALTLWARDEGVPWAALRSRLCFVGVTQRTATSPHTWRWRQHAPWTQRLPAASTRSVSLEPRVWSHLAGSQAKLTTTFPAGRWHEELGPGRDPRTLAALGEAVAIHRCGVEDHWRAVLAGAIRADPRSSRERRQLAYQLTHPPASG